MESINDIELIKKVKAWLKSMLESNGKAWCLSIPPNQNDPDVLITALCERFEYLVQRNTDWSLLFDRYRLRGNATISSIPDFCECPASTIIKSIKSLDSKAKYAELTRFLLYRVYDVKHEQWGIGMMERHNESLYFDKEDPK